MDVADWLRRLGLEQYEPAFRDNDVDGEILPDLTADDLIAIGVTSVGHRRKLLSAIAALDDAVARARMPEPASRLLSHRRVSPASPHVRPRSASVAMLRGAAA